MGPWQDIILMIIKGAFYVYLDPAFYIVLALVAFQYWRMRRGYSQLFGVSGEGLLRQTLFAAIYGLIGGIVGSILLTFVGVSLNNMGLNYIWPVAIFLAFINVRYLCFAYSGGLVAISNLIFGYPQVDVLQVLALVAILHITESILIAIGSRYSAAPLFLKHGSGRIVGAFSLQNFWPLPLLVLFSINLVSQPDGMLNMPDWWPIIKSADVTENTMFALYPVVAALGYSDICITQLPHVKRKESALQLGLYSIILLAMVMLSMKYGWLKVIAAILAPAGHELLININLKRELKGIPLFVPTTEGVMILDTVPGSPGRLAGLKPGDVLVQIGESVITDGYDLAYALSVAATKFDIKVIRNGKCTIFHAQFVNDERRLGVITVPNGQESNYVQLAGDRWGIFSWFHRKRQ